MWSVKLGIKYSKRYHMIWKCRLIIGVKPWSSTTSNVHQWRSVWCRRLLKDDIKNKTDLMVLLWYHSTVKKFYFSPPKTCVISETFPKCLLISVFIYFLSSLTSLWNGPKCKWTRFKEYVDIWNIISLNLAHFCDNTTIPSKPPQSFLTNFQYHSANTTSTSNPRGRIPNRTFRTPHYRTPNENGT